MISVDKIVKTMTDAQKDLTCESFMKTHVSLSDSRQAVREQMQEITTMQMKDIVKKLSGSQELTSQDFDCIRLWIIGDADGYTAMENNFQDWLDDFKRLQGVVSSYQDKITSTQELSKLQGVLEDGLRLSADVGNFLEKKERIGKFESAVKDPASLDREILKHILESKIKSPDL